MSSARDELHRLADELPEELASEVVDFAERLKGRKQRHIRVPLPAAVEAVLAAVPLDDEPLSEVERSEILAARADYERYGGVRLEDVLADLDR